MNQISLSAVAESYGDKPVTMSSRDIAELTNKRHDNVTSDVKKMLEDLGLDVLNFQGIYFDTQNRKQTEYHLDQDLTLTLVAGYDVKLRHAVVKRWKDLETGRALPAMTQPQQVIEADKPDPQAFAVVQSAWVDAVERKIASKREALQFLRDASAVMIHGVDVLQRAAKASKPAKALPAPTQATLTNGESVPYGLRAAGTKSATELLRAHGSAVQAKEFYEVMWSKDMATATRVFENGVGNVTHRILVGDGLKYGQNVMNFDGTHSHPYFYHDKFAALLKRVGLLMDATPKPTASERALLDYKNIVKDAWNTYGCETSESVNRDGIHTPYLTRSALIQYLTIDLGKSEKTAKNFVAPKSDAMRALFKDGFLSQHQNGWLIFDGDSI